MNYYVSAVLYNSRLRPLGKKLSAFLGKFSIRYLTLVSWFFFFFPGDRKFKFLIFISKILRAWKTLSNTGYFSRLYENDLFKRERNPEAKLVEKGAQVYLRPPDRFFETFPSTEGWPAASGLYLINPVRIGISTRQEKKQASRELRKESGMLFNKEVFIRSVWGCQSRKLNC